MNNIFKRTPQPEATALATALIAAGATTPVRKGGENVLDFLARLDRRSQLAGLRSLAGAVQFTLINTADWQIRQEDRKIASDLPSLDERNSHDEFTRGQDEVNELDRLMLGKEAQQTPEEKLKQYSHLYYGLVDTIRNLNPQPFERPSSLRDTLAGFTARGTKLDDSTLELLKAAESEPGEFDAARDAVKSRKTAELDGRKPRILQLLEQHADCNPMVEVFDELPVHTQLRLATAAWKGIYFSRKQLIGYIALTGKTDDIAAVKAMQMDLNLLGAFCEEFEADPKNRDVLDLLIENDVSVYGIEDARRDVKKPKQ